MKKYTTLFIIAIITFTACTRDVKPKEAELLTEEPSLNDYRIGEKWVWLEKSVAEGRTRWEGKELLEIVSFRGTLGFWNGVDTVDVSSTLNQDQGDTPYRSWPLKVGKKWTYESDWKNNEGTPMKTSLNAEVVSYGEEAVLAGRFAAFKIEYKGTITNSIGGASNIHEIYWYAPELKVNIRKVQDDGYGSYVLELYDYKKGE
jgi:hypothetical protein